MPIRRPLLGVLLLLSIPGAARSDAPPHPSHHHADEATDHATVHEAAHGASARADDHAPIGVMGDHLHHAGGFMLSYRFMRMEMDGNRDGSSRVSTNAVHRRFPVAPTDMDMEMHMLGAMWAPSDAVTLMGMVPFTRLDMTHRTRTGRRFRTRSKGIGDVRFSALVRLFEQEAHRLHLNAGISAPTGRTSAKDDTPMGRVRLPYPMQLGSGTWDLLPAITYNARSGDLSWGSRLEATYRTGLGNKGYRWGHRWGASGWLGFQLAPWVSSSLRLAYTDWRGVRGDDDDLLRGLVPTADPDLRAGRRLDLLWGVNLLAQGGFLRGHRLALEVGRPIVQRLDGPQLETDWQLTLGWQKAF